MPDSYTQLYIQLVFAVQHRKTLIQAEWEVRLYRYITGIVQDNGHKMLQINGMPDHIHIFIGYNPIQTLPHLVENIKTSSGAMLRREGLVTNGFNWQAGYGAFSYSKQDINRLIQYIAGQKEHHKIFSFQKEYIDLLNAFEIEFKEKYLFDFLD